MTTSQAGPMDSGGETPEIRRAGGPPDRLPSAKPGLFSAYKPEQGRYTRRGTMTGAGMLIAWGAWFLHGQVGRFQGDELWQIGVTVGIPLLFAVVVGAVAWRVVFASRGTSDFLIATEGEMKKVSWCTKDEVIGSTKVVILFTALLGIQLFVVDIIFQSLFQWVGVLKVAQ